MADNVNWQPPALESSNPNLKTSQKYNNITRSQIRSELAKVRSGDGRPGLGELEMVIWFAPMLKVPVDLWQERIETRLFLMPGVGMGMWVLLDFILY